LWPGEYLYLHRQDPSLPLHHLSLSSDLQRLSAFQGAIERAVRKLQGKVVEGGGAGVGKEGLGGGGDDTDLGEENDQVGRQRVEERKLPSPHPPPPQQQQQPKGQEKEDRTAPGCPPSPPLASLPGRIDALDLGCGTGPLALMAARAGCDSVVGVEAHAGLCEIARTNVALNHLSHKASSFFLQCT
jgi:hypothetical protein